MPHGLITFFPLLRFSLALVSVHFYYTLLSSLLFYSVVRTVHLYIIHMFVILYASVIETTAHSMAVSDRVESVLRVQYTRRVQFAASPAVSVKREGIALRIRGEVVRVRGVVSLVRGGITGTGVRPSVCRINIIKGNSSVGGDSSADARAPPKRITPSRRQPLPPSPTADPPARFRVFTTQYWCYVMRVGTRAYARDACAPLRPRTQTLTTPPGRALPTL